jgi:hypothetical protein
MIITDREEKVKKKIVTKVLNPPAEVSFR